MTEEKGTVTISIEDFDKFRGYKELLDKIKREEFICFYSTFHDEWLYIFDKEGLVRDLSYELKNQRSYAIDLERQLRKAQKPKPSFFKRLFTRTKH